MLISLVAQVIEFQPRQKAEKHFQKTAFFVYFSFLMVPPPNARQHSTQHTQHTQQIQHTQHTAHSSTRAKDDARRARLDPASLGAGLRGRVL